MAARERVTPTPSEIVGDRWRFVLIAAVMAIMFPVFALLAAFSDGWKDTVAGVLGAAWTGLGLLFAASRVFAPVRLELDRLGFTVVQWPYRPLRVRWVDVEGFSAWTYGVVVHHVPERGPRFLWMGHMRRTNISLGPRFTDWALADRLIAARGEALAAAPAPEHAG